MRTKPQDATARAETRVARQREAKAKGEEEKKTIGTIGQPEPRLASMLGNNRNIENESIAATIAIFGSLLGVGSRHLEFAVSSPKIIVDGPGGRHFPNFHTSLPNDDDHHRDQVVADAASSGTSIDGLRLRADAVHLLRDLPESARPSAPGRASALMIGEGAVKGTSRRRRLSAESAL